MNRNLIPPGVADVAEESSSHEGNSAAEMFRLAVQACPDGMVIIDHDGRMALANVAIERQFGYRQEELIGQSADMLVPVRLRSQDARNRGAFNRPAERRHIGAGVDHVGLRKDGSEFFIEVVLTPIPDRTDLPVLGVIVDLSERKRLESLKDEFVSTVSHELRTPLTSISGSLGLLMGQWAGKLPGSAERLLAIAYKNSQRLVRLINDILDIEKIESGHVVFNFIRIGLRQLVEQAIEGNRGFAEGYGVRVRLDAASEDGEVNVDPDRLSQVITNLLSNAIKFSPPIRRCWSRWKRMEILCASLCETTASASRLPSSRIFSRNSPRPTRRTPGKRGEPASVSTSQSKSSNDWAARRALQTRPAAARSFISSCRPPTALTQRTSTSKLDKAPSASCSARTIAKRRPLCASGCERPSSLWTLPNGGSRSRARGRNLLRGRFGQSAAAGRGWHQSDSSNAGLANHRNTPIIVISGDAVRGRSDVRSSRLNVLDWLNVPVEFERLVQILKTSTAPQSPQRARILHLDDDYDVLAVVTDALHTMADVISVDSIESARHALATERIDLAVLDISLGTSSGLDLLPNLRDRLGNVIPVIIFSAHGAGLACDEQVQVALSKSHASIDNLVAAVSDRLALLPARASRQIV